MSTEQSNLSNYRKWVAKKLSNLSDVLARAALGDFSKDVVIPETEDEFAELNVGVQIMLEVVREKMAESERLHKELKDLVTKRERELDLYVSRLSSLAKYAPQYICMVDSDLRFTFVNRTGKGVSQDEVIGTQVGKTMTPYYSRLARRKLREVLKTGEPAEYVFESILKNGEHRWYRTSAGPIFDDGKVTGIVLIIVDITNEHYKTEALLEGKRSAESARVRDRALLNSIGEGLLVIDEQGRISNANPAATSILGYSQRELIGSWFPEKIKAIDEMGQEIHPIERPSLQALASGEVISQVIRYRRKDGSTFPVAVTISPVVIDGKPVGAIEVFRDLTRERELERAKEEFVSLASHQLRTPATGVKAYISMLLDGYGGELSERQQEFMQKVLASNERQLQIVNDMLNVARVDAGRIIPEMTTTDMRALLQDIIDEQRPIIKERQQDLEVTMPRSPFEMEVDPKLMRMALENLISNASKYTPESGTLSIGLQKEHEQAIITIRDNGVGISETDIPKLFKRFSRIDNTLSTQRGGTGLGLYLTQNIVLLHQGRLSVDSKLGKGTIFKLELPLLSSSTGSELHSIQEAAS